MEKKYTADISATRPKVGSVVFDFFSRKTASLCPRRGPLSIFWDDDMSRRVARQDGRGEAEGVPAMSEGTQCYVPLRLNGRTRTATFILSEAMTFVHR